MQKQAKKCACCLQIMGPNRNQHRDNKASEFYRANKASSMTYNKKLKICLNIDPAYLEISQTD